MINNHERQPQSFSWTIYFKLTRPLKEEEKQYIAYYKTILIERVKDGGG